MRLWSRRAPQADRPTLDGPCDELGRAIAIWLSDRERDLSCEIVERLQAGRLRAIANRKVVPQQPRPPLAWLNSSISLRSARIWVRIGSIAPLVVLIAGLALISGELDDRAAQMEAEVDAQLLTDVLPPSAYIDAGFREFLRPTPRRTAVHPDSLKPSAASAATRHA